MVKKSVNRWFSWSLVFAVALVSWSCSGGGGSAGQGTFVSGNLEYSLNPDYSGGSVVFITGPAPGVGLSGNFALNVPSDINGIPVNRIEKNAFKNNLSLTSVTLAPGVALGYDCFAGCANLRSVRLPDSLTSIGDGAFADCVSLESVDLPASLTSIGNHAFAGCTKLTTIEYPRAFGRFGRLPSRDVPRSRRS